MDRVNLTPRGNAGGGQRYHVRGAASFRSFSKEVDAEDAGDGAVQNVYVETLKNLDALTIAGLVLGTIGVISTSITTLSMMQDEVISPENSRSSLLSLFSAVYLLTLCVSSVDFSSINRDKIRKASTTALRSRCADQKSGGQVLCLNHPTKYLGESVAVNEQFLRLVSTLLGSNISVSILASLKNESQDSKKRYVQLLNGISETVPTSDALEIPVLRDELGILNFDGEVLYLPVFNNVPGGVELEACVAKGCECCLVVPIQVWEGGGADEGRKQLGNDGGDGEEFDVEEFYVVVAGGKAKGFTAGDIEWIKNFASGGMIETVK
ncbi:hypothetical protein TrST_g6602 [Triparma strigata]|uniref:Uncharacterized protein n=1 Tax=Triparma strigata TaxID=1606541 RepID=A0A9W7BKM8_9STRA|nr:hypothetical protein TrST_g6602 [Triparma strigata]